jgi:hypothetical protein
VNLIPTALTAWRDERSVEEALAHHDRTALAAAITAIAAVAVKALGGTKYASLVVFLDPDTLSAFGFLVAGGVAGFGHWAARGALTQAAAATPAAAAAADPAAGAVAAPQSQPATVWVRPEPAPLSRQDSDTLRGGA